MPCFTSLVRFAAALGSLLVVATSERAAPAQPPGGEPMGPQAKVLHRFSGLPKWVTGVAFSPDGRSLAASSYQLVRLWDVESKQPSAELKPIAGYAKAVAWSPDGKRVAVAEYGAVTLWEVAGGTQARSLDGHGGYVNAVAFSPDGALVASGGDDQTVRLWNSNDGREQLVIQEFEYPVTGLAFTPDGKWLTVSSGDETRVTKPGPVRVFNAASGEERPLDLPVHEKAATGVAVSADGRWLASTSMDEKVNVYDLASGKAVGFFADHARQTNAAVFLPGGQAVISAGGGRAKGKNDIKLWLRASGDELGTISGHELRVTSIALHPDGKTLASGSYDGTVALWDLTPILEAAGGLLAAAASDAPPKLRAGIIGLDTSHVIAFTKLLNDENAPPELAHCRVVAAYPKGSPDIQSSVIRVPGYTEEIKKLGVEIVDSIDSLLEKVDVVLLETNDGRPHLEQALPVLKTGKPLFIDKPIAGSLADAIAIFEAARKYQTPVWSSSSLRYTPGAQEIRAGKIGRVKSAETYSPCTLEKTHPDLFWYGIHGVELLFTVMGTGCESVRRTVSTPEQDVVVGKWEGGRTGTFTGDRGGGKSGYGGKALGETGEADVGARADYRPLVVEIVKFFRTREVPVSEAETLEIYAFMEAADESKRQEGAEVRLDAYMEKAREGAKRRLEELDRP
ncbi:MAG TPA: Gfo/Idh/MocA family oxidoreductase [Planctomycetaceae bacterium]|nr:Gfo/Idh/MocA family oxidoreductase [Planctomycetaceae bacterium]